MKLASMLVWSLIIPADVYALGMANPRELNLDGVVDCTDAVVFLMVLQGDVADPDVLVASNLDGDGLHRRRRTDDSQDRCRRSHVGICR